ncbi:MAG: DUF1254 domain-containing protein [Candidatus Cybelea sp.]|jgi:hypothetical protein
MTQTIESTTVQVTADNFVRAESHMYFSTAVRLGGFGKFYHYRDPMPIDDQGVVRANRDTLYSAAVFDLDGGPVTISLPDSGGRFRSMFAVNEDEYALPAIYDAGSYTLSKDLIGTRYVLVGLRTLVDPESPEDLASVHALQDAVEVNQASPGRFEVPEWDSASQKTVRDALLTLSSTLPDMRRAFGRKEDVDPIRHFIAAASAWGGNPEKDAIYLNVTPAENDGKAVYKIIVKDVPVNGFWSISVYNSQGYFEKNAQNAYTLNGITAKKGADGSATIQFGGCDGTIPNCLPITPGWNYMVRLYRPRAEILNGSWHFPEAAPVG